MRRRPRISPLAAAPQFEPATADQCEPNTNRPTGILLLHKRKSTNNWAKLFRAPCPPLCLRLPLSRRYNGALWPSCAERKRAAFHRRPRHTAERKMSPLLRQASTPPPSCLDHPDHRLFAIFIPPVLFLNEFILLAV